MDRNLGSFGDENEDERGGLGDCDDDVAGDGGEVVIGLNHVYNSVPKSKIVLLMKTFFSICKNLFGTIAEMDT